MPLPPFTRALVLSPHTDDAEFGAGGLIGRLVAEGVHLHHVVFSIARQSVPEGFPDHALRHEAQQAGDILGIPTANLNVLDLPVRHFPEFRQTILETLVRLKADFDPDLVLAHNSLDLHQDHQTIHAEAVRAFKDRTILGYEQPWNLIESRLQCVIALEEAHIERKIQAITVYQTQQRRAYADPAFIRGWARTRGIAIGAPFAEAFEVIRWIIR